MISVMPQHLVVVFYFLLEKKIPSQMHGTGKKRTVNLMTAEQTHCGGEQTRWQPTNLSPAAVCLWYYAKLYARYHALREFHRRFDLALVYRVKYTAVV